MLVALVILIPVAAGGLSLAIGRMRFALSALVASSALHLAVTVTLVATDSGAGTERGMGPRRSGSLLSVDPECPLRPGHPLYCVVSRERQTRGHAGSAPLRALPPWSFWQP